VGSHQGFYRLTGPDLGKFTPNTCHAPMWINLGHAGSGVQIHNTGRGTKVFFFDGGKRECQTRVVLTRGFLSPLSPHWRAQRSLKSASKAREKDVKSTGPSSIQNQDFEPVGTGILFACDSS